MRQIDKSKDYYIFDVDGFFRDYKKNKRKLKDLEWEKAQAITSGGTDYSKPRVTGGLPTSVVESKAELIMGYDEQIAEMQEYFERAELFLGLLTEEERAIAESYFIQGRRNRYGIDAIGYKCGRSRTSVYRAIQDIRAKIRKYVGKEGA